MQSGRTPDRGRVQIIMPLPHRNSARRTVNLKRATDWRLHDPTRPSMQSGRTPDRGRVQIIMPLPHRNSARRTVNLKERKAGGCMTPPGRVCKAAGRQIAAVYIRVTRHKLKSPTHNLIGWIEYHLVSRLDVRLQQKILCCARACTNGHVYARVL
jgi:hypothetical protein